MDPKAMQPFGRALLTRLDGNADSQKQVVVLVGLKGAGKSTIGDLLSRKLGIHFLRVEPLFLQVRARRGAGRPDYEQEGFELVLESIREALLRHDTLCFETTGASARVAWLLSELAKVARIFPVRIVAEADQCLARIHGRDTSIHIPVSDDDVERINAAAADVDLPWAAEIDNRGPFEGEHILSTIRHLLART